MGLRLTEGLDLTALSLRLGIAKDRLIDVSEAAKLASLGLIRQHNSRITVTPAGMPLLDAILPRIVADSLVSA